MWVRKVLLFFFSFSFLLFNYLNVESFGRFLVIPLRILLDELNSENWIESLGYTKWVFKMVLLIWVLKGNFCEEIVQSLLDVSPGV